MQIIMTLILREKQNEGYRHNNDCHCIELYIGKWKSSALQCHLMKIISFDLFLTISTDFIWFKHCTACLL